MKELNHPLARIWSSKHTDDSVATIRLKVFNNNFIMLFPIDCGYDDDVNAFLSFSIGFENFIALRIENYCSHLFYYLNNIKNPEYILLDDKQHKILSKRLKSTYPETYSYTCCILFKNQEDMLLAKVTNLFGLIE